MSVSAVSKKSEGKTYIPNEVYPNLKSLENEHIRARSSVKQREEDIRRSPTKQREEDRDSQEEVAKGEEDLTR